MVFLHLAGTLISVRFFCAYDLALSSGKQAKALGFAQVFRHSRALFISIGEVRLPCGVSLIRSKTVVFCRLGQVLWYAFSEFVQGGKSHLRWRISLIR